MCSNSIFIWIPKCGGTTVRNSLPINKIKKMRRGNRITSGHNTFGHIDIRSLLKFGIITQHYFDKSYIYTFVRNPYTRAVSLYEHMRRKGKIKKTKTFRSFLMMIKKGIKRIGLYNVNGMSQCNPQHNWISGIQCDIYKLEDFEESFLTICEKIYGRQYKIIKENIGNYKKNNIYDTYYGKEEYRLVNDIYRKDFNYGYDFR